MTQIVLFTAGLARLPHHALPNNARGTRAVRALSTFAGKNLMQMTASPGKHMCCQDNQRRTKGASSSMTVREKQARLLEGKQRWALLRPPWGPKLPHLCIISHKHYAVARVTRRGAEETLGNPHGCEAK